MSQGDIIKLLEKSKVGLCARDIHEKTKIGLSSLNESIKKLRDFNEIEVVGYKRNKFKHKVRYYQIKK